MAEGAEGGEARGAPTAMGSVLRSVCPGLSRIRLKLSNAGPSAVELLARHDRLGNQNHSVGRISVAPLRAAELPQERRIRLSQT